MRLHPLILIGLAVLLLPATGCYYDVESELYPSTFCDTTTAVTYSGTIVPILQANCTVPGCHTPGSPSNIDLTTYAGLRTQVLNGKLVPAVRQTGGAQPMPQNGRLRDCDMNKIAAWVQAGAQND